MQHNISLRARAIPAFAVLVALVLTGLAALTAVHPHGARPTLPVQTSARARIAQVPAAQPDTTSLEHELFEARARWYSAVRRNAELERARGALQLIATAQQRRAMWDELAHCESGGNWNVVDRFGGGLGIYIGTWHMFNGDEFASNPGYATKDQQIIVAERVYARFGLSGWGCAHSLGWVH
jgi:hypothetical protein